MGMIMDTHDLLQIEIPIKIPHANAAASPLPMILSTSQTGWPTCRSNHKMATKESVMIMLKPAKRLYSTFFEGFFFAIKCKPVMLKKT